MHSRECQADIINQLRILARPIRGVMHAFSGTWEDAEAFLQLGLHLSFAGIVTFTNKSLDALRAVAARVPVDRLIIETDSPYLSPHPFRGQTNEPARVAVTAARLAQLRGLSLDDFARITTANARDLFRLPPDRTLLSRPN
jgi:TatD DNase family protein